MAKPDINSNLVPFLIAGILSGGLSATLFRPGGGAKGGGASAAAEVESLDAAGPSSWVADLHPVLDALSAALSAPGESAEHSAARALVAAAATKTATGDEVLAALETMRKGLDEAESAGVECGSTGALISAAGTLGGYLLTTGDGDAKSARYGAAKALLEEYREWRRLTELAQRVKDSKEPGSSATYDVDFIIATVPDYVDSNSGWLADENLAAIQSSMVRNNYVLDRPQLVDWSRATARADGLTSTSRLHERQPGALLFRKVDPDPRDHVQLQVVLLVLETPTAGVHHAALRNAAAFVRAWKSCTGESRHVLRVLGPSFSGSTLSLAIVLNEIRSNDSSSFQETWVVSGSATADSNADTMKTFAPGVNYRATVLASSILEKRMAAFLERMNPLWSKGNRVALLIESNTAYGHAYGRKEATPSQQTFPLAKVFNFPLHVAQLWSELPETTSAPLFAPGPVIPLNMREAAPPSDQIPALRPALTSAVVASTVEAILDAIRHEHLSAIGIVATDNRDALFLAREVKRSTPDAQLFLFATHALYLHPDYVPYLRGALVASSYSLALANQPETKAWWPESIREPFQSQSSEGVFNATRVLLSVEGGAVKEDGTFRLVPCPPQAPDDSCIRVPQATINVIGEDGYWTLPLVPNPQIAGEPTATATRRLLPLLPQRALFAALIVIGIVGLHILMFRRIRNDLRKQVTPSRPPAASALEWPIVRMFAPPRTVPGAARNHLLALRVCLLFLGLASAWVVVTTVPFMIGLSMVRAIVTGVLALAALALTVVPAWAWCGESKRLADAMWHEDGRAEAPSQMTPVAKGLFLTLILTLGSFAAVIVHTVVFMASPDAGALMLARYVGGGVVSPAALTLLTLTAVYAALITGLRRLSLVGYGYAHLTARSPAFSLLTGEKPLDSTDRARPSQFACILDMPAQNLPAPYLGAVLAVAAVAAISLLRISSLDGRLFTLFLGVSSLAVLAIGLLLLAQGLATWNIARAHLTRLVHSPIEARLASVASFVPWDISLAPPKLTQLMPVARMADGVIREFRRIAGVPPPVTTNSPTRRAIDCSSVLIVAAVEDFPLRKDDLQELQPLFAPPSQVEQLETEMQQRQSAALIQSDSWRSMWKLSDAIVSAMQRGAWERCDPPMPARRAPDLEHENSREQPLTPQSLASLVLPDTPKPPHAALLERCEQLVALQLAFVLRDIVARTVTCLFAAMLCLTLLTAAHLLYSFNGRNTTLTIDMLAVAATAVVSVWVLVDMERDHILSRLRTTTPGRVDINWDFFKRIAVYGVLPLLVVIASLFPEVGGTLFGWLEPLRKLSSF